MIKKFAYCIGGCREVPPFLSDLTTDRADCFAVFFKQPGPPGTIYLPNSTTTTGRDAAFNAAKDGGYEYVILMDDDVAFEGMSHADGFRKLEQLLDEFRPAVASPRYSWHLKGSNKYSHQNLDKRLQGLCAADALVNAVHRDVWPLVLPHWSGGDAASWWNSAQVFHRIIAMLWPGAFVQFNDLVVTNLISGPYPREGKCTAADAYLEEMTVPEWRPHLLKYSVPETFHERHPVLRQDYTLTREEVGRYFNLDHPYWVGRL